MNDGDQPDSPPGSRGKRLSISKKQLQSDSAVELVALCQSITADGSLSDAEVAALKRWLSNNKNADLPAIGFLTRTVEKITADKRITTEERKALHEALEAVLPPEIRRSVKGKRQELERIARAERKFDERLAREQAIAEAERDSPIASFDFMVAGVQHDGRYVYVKHYAQAGVAARLARDPNNRFSRNAVQVRLEDRQIGYVPEEDASELAPLLDAGHPYVAEVKKVLTGGNVPRPVVVVDVLGKDAHVEGMERAPTIAASTSSRRPFGIILFLVMLLIGYVAFMGYRSFQGG